MESEGERRRDEAIERVDKHAEEVWRIEARRAARWVCTQRAELTSEDVRDALERYRPDLGTHELRAYGPVMQWLQRHAYAAPTGEIRSYRNPSRHAGTSRVWRSLIHEADE